MKRPKFKIALLDEFNYPIARYELEIEGETTEESVRKSLDDKVSQLTILIQHIERDGSGS